MKSSGFKLRSTGAANEHEMEVDTEGSWAISYGDMITLLLSFFILFFSLEKPSPKVNRVKSALLNDLNANEVTGSQGKGDRQPSAAKAAEGDTKVTYPKEFGGVAYEVKDKLLVEFPDVSFFDSAKVDLNEAGQKSIAEFGKKFAPYATQFNVVIQAYADPRKVRPNRYRFKDNLELSALRSIATMRALKESGVPLSRMRTAGYGELILTARDLDSIDPKLRKPTSLNDLARRIVLVLEPGGKP